MEENKLLLPDYFEKVPLFLPKQVDFWVILPVFYFEQEGLCIVVARFVFKGFDFGVDKEERLVGEAKERARERGEETRRGRARGRLLCDEWAGVGDRVRARP